jgi:alpha/beta superfamily hydrolase
VTVPPVRALSFALLVLVASCAISCGEATTSAPPPEVVATAESNSRVVSIDVPIAATTPGGPEAEPEAVSLAGHVFGTGTVGVILAHMRPADQTAWFPFALRLAATGKFTVLTFDFRGFGDSAGEKDFDLLDTDLAAAYQYVLDDLKIEEVFLVGASMGGTASLVVSSDVHVAGVVSISSAAQFQTLDALGAVASISAPKLFISSEDDVPAARSEEQLWLSAAEPKDHEIYSGDAHGTDLFVGIHQVELEQRILNFLTSP